MSSTNLSNPNDPTSPSNGAQGEPSPTSVNLTDYYAQLAAASPSNSSKTQSTATSTHAADDEKRDEFEPGSNRGSISEISDDVLPLKLGEQTTATPPALSPASGIKSTNTTEECTGSPRSSTDLNILELIMGRFVEAHTDLTQNPTRKLIKEGKVQRIATFKTVVRTVFLFSDCFLITDEVEKGSNAGKLIQKQLLDLRSVIVEDACSKNKKANPLQFNLLSPQRDFSFICNNANEKSEWISLIRETAAAHKLRHQSLTQAPVKGKVFSLGDTAEDYEGRLLSITLHDAIRDNRDEIVLYLLSERDEDANQKDDQGTTPLHVAIQRKNAFAVSLLLGYGADVALADRELRTPLHLACAQGDFATAMLLISKGAEVNVYDMYNWSPLWYLCNYDHQPENSSGEDEKKDKIDESFVQSLSDMVSVMMDAGATLPLPRSTPDAESGPTLLSYLAARGKWASMQAVLRKSVYVNEVDAAGRTPIHTAVIYASKNANEVPAAAPTSDSSSSSPSATTSSAQYPTSQSMDHAVRLIEYLNTIKILLAQGAFPNGRDNLMNTPLHYALDLSVAGVLIVNGARGDLKNLQGKAASEYFEDRKIFYSEKEFGNNQLAIKDAYDAWKERGDTVSEDWEADESNWMSDDAIQNCMCCSLPFTLTRRKHHCRKCGTVVCAQCSTKKFKPATALKKKTDEDMRCCDPCFNMMVDEQVRQAKLRREARKRELENERKEKDVVDQKKKEEEERRQEIEAELREERAAMLKAARERASSNADNRRKTATSSKDAHSVNSQMNANMRMMQERGQKLSEMTDKSEQLQDQASNFYDMARKLKEEQKKKSTWGFF